MVITRRTFIAGASCAFPLIGAGAAELSPLRIEAPSKTNLQFLSLWVAIGSSAFQKQGLSPELLVAPNPRATGELLFAGKADVALLPPPMFLGMMAENRPVRLFASLLANEPINLVLRKDVALQRGIQAGAPLPEKLRALVGLKVGLAPEVAPRLREIFAAAGMLPDNVLTSVTTAGPQQVQAFADGRVDLLFAHTPYLETALVRYGGVLVVDASSGDIASLGEGQIHALATTAAVMRDTPDLIRKTASAIAAAEQLIHSDQKAALDALLKSGAQPADPKLAAAIIAVYAPAVPRDARISLSGIIRDRDLYPAHPRAPDFRIVDVHTFVPPEFTR